jgi:site-specific DNA-methyltransferase (adenine-specific)
MNKHLSEVTNEDCMEGMARYPDKYFDLAIVDPPYGIGESSKNRNGITKRKDKRNGRISYIKTNNEIKDWDKTPPPVEYFIELQRVSKNQIIWGANHFIENIPQSNSSCWIIWDKCNGISDFADCELAWSSFKTAVRQFRYMWNGMFQGKQSFKHGHIFEGNLSLHEKRIHKTQKPVALYKWLLHNYAKQGDKILDTHLGSGSSRIAAYEMGFDFTAFELDAEYFEAQEKRYKAHIAQLKLELI